jgi:hypothetical protein
MTRFNMTFCCETQQRLAIGTAWRSGFSSTPTSDLTSSGVQEALPSVVLQCLFWFCPWLLLPLFRLACLYFPEETVLDPSFNLRDGKVVCEKEVRGILRDTARRCCWSYISA